MGPIKLHAQTIYGDEPATLDELGHALIKMINANDIPTPWGKKKTARATCVGLEWDIKWTDRVPSGYDAPEGCKPGWLSRNDGLESTQNYPGWVGRVWVRYANEKSRGFGFGSDPFNNTLTYTGTGGFGSYDGPWNRILKVRYHNHRTYPYPEPNVYSWDFRIFAQDWPLIAEEFDKDRAWHILSGKPWIHSKHSFSWNDLEQEQRDQEYMTMVDNALKFI